MHCAGVHLTFEHMYLIEKNGIYADCVPEMCKGSLRRSHGKSFVMNDLRFRIFVIVPAIDGALTAVQEGRCNLLSEWSLSAVRIV